MQYVGLGLVEEAGELGQLGAKLIGNAAPRAFALSASSCAKAVTMNADTTRRP